MQLVKFLVSQTAAKVGKGTFNYNKTSINLYGKWKTIRLDELVSNGTLEEKYEIFEKEIAPTLMQPTFVTHLPKSLVPLAKESKEFPGTAEVFEFYLCGQEIAPGYTEENDPTAQLESFKKQSKDGHVMDNDFIEVLKYGMPPAGGMGIGIDRLVAIIHDQPSIRDVILFPILRKKT